MRARGIHGGAQDIAGAHPRDLNGVLKRQKNPCAGTSLWAHLQQIVALIEHLAGGDMIVRSPGQHLRQRTLARPIGAHYGMDLASVHREIDAAQDLVTSGTHM